MSSRAQIRSDLAVFEWLLGNGAVRTPESRKVVAPMPPVLDRLSRSFFEPIAGTGVKPQVEQAPSKKKQLLAPSVAFTESLIDWVAVSEKKVIKSISNAHYSMTDAAQLILARVDKSFKELIAGTLIDLIQLPTKIDIAKALIQGLVAMFQEQAERKDTLDKDQFIDEFQKFFDALEEGLLIEIKAQAGRWLRQIESAAKPADEEDRIRPLLKDTGAIVPREVYLAEIMKKYWDLRYPVAKFEIPAMQGPDSTSPVAPNGIQNWPKVMRAILRGDRSWTSIKGRDIEVSAGGQRRVFRVGTSERDRVEAFLLSKRRLLEHSQAVKNEERSPAVEKASEPEQIKAATLKPTTRDAAKTGFDEQESNSAATAGPLVDSKVAPMAAPAHFIPFPGRVISAGSKDVASIRVIQKRLNQLGCGPVVEDGVFGPETAEAVELFQARSADHLGTPLQVDGSVGPMTWAALFGAKPALETAGTQLQTAVLEIAASQIGVMEQPPGSNRGPKVDEYLHSVDINPASGSFPWCAAFVYWCFQEAARKTGLPNPAIRTAGVLNSWNRAGSAGVPRISASEAASSPGLVKPGMVFVLSTGAGNGHTGFVERVDGTVLTTIEGNTNVGGSREGVGVFRRNGRRIAGINRGFMNYV